MWLYIHNYMSYFVGNIEELSLKNTNFRQVLFTSHLQLVVMSLKPLEDIGMEIHPKTDQFIRIEEGSGVALLNGHMYTLQAGMSVVIPAGVEHNIINTHRTHPMKLYTIYTPPEHPIGTRIKNKP
jgi:mannose-6-phosphate isomerase-like protein (cupin superfamily)